MRACAARLQGLSGALTQCLRCDRVALEPSAATAADSGGSFPHLSRELPSCASACACAARARCSGSAALSSRGLEVGRWLEPSSSLLSSFQRTPCWGTSGSTCARTGSQGQGRILTAGRHSARLSLTTDRQRASTPWTRNGNTVSRKLTETLRLCTYRHC